MKKRPLPIPLILAFALCLIIVGYINFKSAPQAPDEPKQTPPPVEGNALGQARKAPGKDEIRANVDLGTPEKANKPLDIKPAPGQPPIDTVGGQHQSPPKGGPGMPPGGMPPGGMPKPQKPKPNESSISTQWYTDETTPGKK